MFQMQTLFNIDFARFMSWNEPVADFHLELFSPALVSGRSPWTQCLCEQQTTDPCQTAHALKVFMDQLETNADAQKTYRIMVPAKSQSHIQVCVLLTQAERYFSTWGDLPCADKLSTLMINAYSERLLCIDKSEKDVYTTTVNLAHIGKPMSVRPPSVPNLCYFHQDSFEWRHVDGEIEPIKTDVNFSIIIGSANTKINDIIKSQNWIEAAKSLKLRQFGRIYNRDALWLYVPVHLIIDDQAPMLHDVKILTPALLTSEPVLRIHPDDLLKWDQTRTLFVTSSLRITPRMYLTRVEKNPNLFVNLNYVHWASVSMSKSTTITTTILPSADWYFFLDASTSAYVRRSIGVDVWYSICTDLQIRPPFAAQALVASSSWVHTSSPNLSIKLSISNYAKWEHKVLPRTVAANPLDIHMAQFGLRAEYDSDMASAYTRSSFWHRALKSGTLLHVSNIDKAFDGYKHQSALKLGSKDIPTCEICADAKADALLDNCGHLFCVRCLNLMFATTTEPNLPCPSCRSRFTTKEWTSLTKKRTLVFPNLVLSKQTQLEKCIQDCESVPDSNILIVCAEDQTMAACQSWAPKSVTLISFSTWEFDQTLKDTYTHIIFTWSNFRIGSTASKFVSAKAHTLVQNVARERCTILLLTESGEEALAMDWQSQIANLFPNTTQLSTYAHDGS